MTKRPSLSQGIKSSKLAEDMKTLSETTAPNPTALVERAHVSTPLQEPKLVGKRYEGMKKMLIPLDPAVHRQLKMLAVQNDMTLEKVVQEAIARYIDITKI